MEICFNSDGSVEGLSTKENQEFLSKLGEIIDFGNSEVKIFRKNSNSVVYEVVDEAGHDCAACNELSHYFLLIRTFANETILCKKCLGMT
jgi:hypothetical protein